MNLNYLFIRDLDAEVILEIIKDYPQSVKWSIKGVTLKDLETRLTAQLTKMREHGAVLKS